MIKSYRDIDTPESCPNCAILAIRTIAKSQGLDKTSAGDWNAKAYNPAFGKALSPSEARKEAKKRGWEEVGTESISKIQKAADATREKNLKDRWDKVNLTDLGEVK